MKDYTDEILEIIDKSAEDIEVPANLMPQQVKEKLDKRKKTKKMRKMTQLAAGFAVVLAVGGAGFGVLIGIGGVERSSYQETEESTQEEYQFVYDMVLNYNSTSMEDGGEKDFVVENEEAVSNGGIIADEYAEYSGTNVQVEGIDESDFVKIDEDYIYLLSEDKINIINIQSDEMQLEGSAFIELDNEDCVKELYVGEDRLYVIVQRQQREVEQRSKTLVELFLGTDERRVYTVCSTELITYDISDKDNIKKIGMVSQDGAYLSSRMKDEMIYLFTKRDVSFVTEEDKDRIIPMVNGEKVPSDCIYIMRECSNETIISSIDVGEPDEVYDVQMIFNHTDDVYMGLDSIYLYQDIYKDGASCTQIVEYEYQDGKLEKADEATIRGQIRDAFAISSQNGYLRILTSESFSGERANALYILDSSLQEVSVLDGIAPGENIYSARYIGDTVYFVTYRNIDPLFAVDLSDVTQPRVLGYLKITGFSEYLHPYGENLLLGIGYETDPETGIILGVKMTMFDITDPTNLKVLDSVFLEDIESCDVVDEYKAALVSEQKNLIGYPVESYYMVRTYYKLYSWNQTHFQEILTQDVGDIHKQEQTRGLYSGERFYVITEKEVTSYHMEKGFSKIDCIQL